MHARGPQQLDFSLDSEPGSHRGARSLRAELVDLRKSLRYQLLSLLGAIHYRGCMGLQELLAIVSFESGFGCSGDWYANQRPIDHE